MKDFDIHDRLKARELPPVYFYMQKMTPKLSIKVASSMHHTPSYNTRPFYKPISSCINLPGHESTNQ